MLKCRKLLLEIAARIRDDHVKFYDQLGTCSDSGIASMCDQALRRQADQLKFESELRASGLVQQSTEKRL